MKTIAVLLLALTMLATPATALDLDEDIQSDNGPMPDCRIVSVGIPSLTPVFDETCARDWLEWATGILQY